MATRLNPAHDQRTRDKIKTSQLINRLQKIANGEIAQDPNVLGVQVRAALGLLAKTLPDLKATEHSAKDGQAVGGLFWISPKAP